MKITTLPFAGSVLPKDINNKTVVVIDVLRATSTIITALMHGAKQIFPVVDIKNAFDLKKQFSPGEVLLCGERDAKIIAGFDFGNSPLEYT
ncbi:MAG: 2-phosphosulfolactate phosphatase, partial [Bacteroidetes bacterium]|nr:2-phosphosulfolactate phosphatase [Bacteroidota bacterium]